VEVIDVNNQIATQIVITMGNLGTWQRTIIKRSMEFKGSTHVVIPHSRMELLKGKISTL